MENSTKKPTIEDLLNALRVDENGKFLPNNADTWGRIGAKDSFSELGLSGTELEDFLKDWIEENPYNNI
jgi:hypothetical protein